MSDLLDDIRVEIEELHDFFVAWYGGTARRESLETRFLSHLHPDILMTPPDGSAVGFPDLSQAFQKAHGMNANFRIRICDVEIRHRMPEHLLVTYTEWQSGSTVSQNPENARFTTALITRQQPFKWLHIQETRLSEAAHQSGRAAGYFDF